MLRPLQCLRMRSSAPQSAPLLLIIYGDGQVDWPEAGWAGLEIADGTRFTALWALLLLRPPAGGSDLRVLLIADQLDMVTWRTLLARVGQAHAVGRSRRAEHEAGPICVRIDLDRTLVRRITKQRYS